MEMQPRKLIIMGIRGIPAAHGGFETFAEHLAFYLRDRGWHVTVYCQEGRAAQRYIDQWEGIERIHIPVRRSGALGTVEFDIKCVADVAGRDGVILTLGYNTGFLAPWLQLKGRRNFINMDGIEWKRDKYGLPARLYLWVNERLAAWSGAFLIADHPQIEQRLRLIAPRADIIMIPYGGDAPDAGDINRLAELGLEEQRYFTVIARPEAENSILEIVEAFSGIRQGVKLVVLGIFDPAVDYQARVLAAAGQDILFPGPIYDKATLHALRKHCIAYLHGHRVGGTNPSLVEALAAGNAIIAHDNMFNRWVAGDAALYFSDIAGCQAAITRVARENALRGMMQKNAISRWKTVFDWPMILSEYEELLSCAVFTTSHDQARQPVAS